MKRFATILLAVRIPVLLLFIVLTAASVWTLPHINLDLSIVPLLKADETNLQKARDFSRALPQTPVEIIITVQWPHAIGSAQLIELGRFGERISQLPEVRSVTSLATVQVIEAAGPGSLLQLLPRPKSLLQLSADEPVSAIVDRHPLLQHRLISKDRRSAVILVHRAPRRDAQAKSMSTSRYARLETIETFAESNKPAGTTVRLLGPPLIERAMRRTMIHDMIQCVALELLFFLILLPILFRTLRGLVIPLLVITTALALHLGLTYFLGWSISIIETAIPGLIIIIALCDAIHMMHRYENALAEHQDRRRAILEMMEKVGLACFYTSLTTALGFLSLLIAPHPAIRDFAYSASIGIGIAFICVVTLMPILLSLWPAKPKAHSRTVKLPLPMYGRPMLTGILFLILALAAALGTQRIVIDSRWLEELPDSTPAVQNLHWYEANFGGILRLDVQIVGDLNSPKVLRLCEALQQRVAGEQGVSHVESYTQWAREMLGNPKTPGGTLDDRQLKRGLALIKLTGNMFPKHLITTNFDRGRIRFFTTDVGTNRFLELKSIIESHAQTLEPDLKASVIGFDLIAHQSTRLVVTTMMSSFMLSVLVITAFIMLAYRSIKLGLIALVPNVLPILIGLGLTGWLGIDLRIGIVMIYCVGIGLAVDDSIHVLTRYSQERRDHPDQSVGQHLTQTMRSTGSALVITSVVLGIGTLSYLPSSFKSLRDVGILLTAIVTTALLADLYLLPHLIERFYADKPEKPEKPEQPEQ